MTTTEVSLFFVLLGINLGRFIFEQTLRFVESLVLSESQCGFRSLVEEAHCGLGFKFEAATGDNDKHIFNTFDDITKVSDTVLRMLFGSSFGTWVFLKGYLL